MKQIPTFSRARERWQAVSKLFWSLRCWGSKGHSVVTAVVGDAEMRASVGDLAPRRNSAARSDMLS